MLTKVTISLFFLSLFSFGFSLRDSPLRDARSSPLRDVPMTIFSSPSLTSSQPPVEYQGYLQQLWSLQRIRYELNWQLYTGEKWLEVDTRKDSSESQRKYRLGVNDMALACNMHA